MGIQWVEARDAADHPECTAQAPQQLMISKMSLTLTKCCQMGNVTAKLNENC